MRLDRADSLISNKLDRRESAVTLKKNFFSVKSEEDPKPNAKS